jgi:hypothetical protein
MLIGMDAKEIRNIGKKLNAFLKSQIVDPGKKG